MKLRELIFKFSQLIDVKFGTEYFVIKQSNKISFGELQELYSGGVVNRKNLDKMELRDIILKYPSDNNIEVIEMLFTGTTGIWQIFARDKDSNILIIATWNIIEDIEVGMYQFRCDSENPHDFLLESIGQEERIIRQQEDDDTINEIKIKKGLFNFILQLCTF